MVGVEEGQQDALQIDFRIKNSSWYLQLVAECFCIILFYFWHLFASCSEHRDPSLRRVFFFFCLSFLGFSCVTPEDLCYSEITTMLH